MKFTVTYSRFDSYYGNQTIEAFENLEDARSRAYQLRDAILVDPKKAGFDIVVKSENGIYREKFN